MARFDDSGEYVVCEHCRLRLLYVGAVIDSKDGSPDVDRVALVLPGWRRRGAVISESKEARDRHERRRATAHAFLRDWAIQRSIACLPYRTVRTFPDVQRCTPVYLATNGGRL